MAIPRKRLFLTMCSLILLLLSGCITLAFDVLPSEQGWIYVDDGSGIDETVIYTTNAMTGLQQTAVGIGSWSPHYELRDVVIPERAFSLSVSVQISDYETLEGDDPFGFTIAVAAGSELYRLGISPNGIVAGDGTVFSTAIDVTQRHNYVLNAASGFGYQLSIDDVIVGTTSVETLDMSANYLMFGDGTRGANANALLTAYTFNQDPNFGVDTVSDADLRGCSFLPDDCSLRGAIHLANANMTIMSASIGFDTEVFATAQTITLTGDLPSISSYTNLQRPNLLTIDGVNRYRPFHITSTGNVQLNGLIIANGRAEDGGGLYNEGTVIHYGGRYVGNYAFEGGAIHNQGTLTLYEPVFSDNRAGDGGAVYNEGTMDIRNAAFSNNGAGVIGGAVYNRNQFTLENSTFEGNTAYWGGGIYNGSNLTVTGSLFTGGMSEAGIGIFNDGTAWIGNSTFTGMTLYPLGGAIRNENALTLVNSTISGNFTPGIVSYPRSPAATTIHNSIITHNSYPNCVGTQIVGEYNIDSGTSCGFGATSLNNTDPLLLPLQNNGGMTQTMALDVGSPAIDAGSHLLAVDQNGIPLLRDQRSSNFYRLVGANVDMGAYEVQTTSSVRLRVEYQGHSPTPPANANVWTSVSFTKPDYSQPSFNYSAYPDASGFIMLSAIPSGDYAIRVKARYTLSRVVSVRLMPGENVIDIPMLLSGDANSDDQITLPDFSLLAGAFGKISGEPGFDQRADFNADRRITLIDFSILASNFGMQGEMIQPPPP